jgi:tryptophan synthase alpha chain
MSRLASTFERLRAAGRPGLITYLTAGDPDLGRSAELLGVLDRAGADVLEVGVPFSDPVADGPVIQRAAERALAAGGSLSATLTLVERVRQTVRAPIVLFTYANPVLRYGVERFADRAARAGVDGVLVLDLPLEEAEELRGVLAGRGLDMILLLAPTTTDARVAEAARLGSGFLYAISRLGVTGAGRSPSDQGRALVQRIRARSPLPVALGFGISRPEHVRQAAQWADAVVVGSGLVSVIAEAAQGPDLGARVAAYVRRLAEGLAGDTARGRA